MAETVRKFKIGNSFGIYDVYKHIRKKGWYNIGRPLKEHEFYTIIRQVNLLLAESIADGETVLLPEKMGKLELRKYKRGVYFKDGKLKNTYPIDWKSTNRLWTEDKEAKEKNILIRFETPLLYHVKYCKEDATYENKTFYQFRLNTFIRKALKQNIIKGKTDTLW